MLRTVHRPNYELIVIEGGHGLNPEDDNVDTEIRFRDGRRYFATFFTTANIRTLFEKNRKTGECADGTYLYATDMIIVERLTLENITNTIDDLIKEGELHHACSSTDEPP